MTALKTWLPAPNLELSTPILGKRGARDYDARRASESD